MPARFLIIDGYNLLHAAGMAQRDYAHGDLQRCRTRLIRFLLQKLSAAELGRAVLVFDARVPPPDRPNEFRISGLKVQFANPGGDADEMIERLLAEHSAPGRVTLISSDRRLQTAARRRHSKPVASEEFFDQLERRDRPSRHDELSPADPYTELKQGRSLTTGEVAAWQKVFGDIPGATWTASVQKAPVQPSASDENTAREETSSPGKKAAKAPPKPAPGKRAKPARRTPQRDAVIPDVTWDDLCRWLDNDTWLSEFSPDDDGSRN